MQQSLFTGEALKEIALDGLEIKHGDFLGTARSVAKCLARKNGSVTMDEVREVLDKLGLAPDHCNVFGAVFRGEKWQSVGSRKSRRPSSHSRWVQVWRLDEPEKINYQPPRRPHWEETSHYNSFHREG